MSYFDIACPGLRLYEIIPAESAELHLRPACDTIHPAQQLANVSTDITISPISH